MRSDDAGTGFEAIAAVGWAWSSLRWQGKRGRKHAPEFLSDGPVERGRNWRQTVNRPMTEAEMLAIRTSVNRGTPWGNPTWQKRTAGRLGLESSLRPKGRPRLEKGEKRGEKRCRVSFFGLAKSADKAIRIGPIQLERKSGGKSGDFVRSTGT